MRKSIFFEQVGDGFVFGFRRNSNNKEGEQSETTQAQAQAGVERKKVRTKEGIVGKI